MLKNFYVLNIEVNQSNGGMLLAMARVVKVDMGTVVLLKVSGVEELEFLRDVVLKKFSVQRISKTRIAAVYPLLIKTNRVLVLDVLPPRKNISENTVKLNAHICLGRVIVLIFLNQIFHFFFEHIFNGIVESFFVIENLVISHGPLLETLEVCITGWNTVGQVPDNNVCVVVVFVDIHLLESFEHVSDDVIDFSEVERWISQAQQDVVV